ncbi:MAG: hypothetical protein IPI63_03780 [Methanothrix sp.]|nr:hypothetical protein [Methanothrix sp.]MBK7385878.1 hypothetical protein [Methanothrix sp.]
MLGQSPAVDLVSSQGGSNAVVDPLPLLIAEEVEGAGKVEEVLLCIGKRA